MVDMASCFRRNKLKKQLHSRGEVNHSLSVYHSVSLNDDVDQLDLNLFSTSNNNTDSENKHVFSETHRPLVNSKQTEAPISNGHTGIYIRNTNTKTPTNGGWTMPTFAYKNRFSLEEAVSKLREMDKDDNLTKVTSSYKYRGNIDSHNLTDSIDVDDIVINGYPSTASLLREKQRSSSDIAKDKCADSDILQTDINRSIQNSTHSDTIEHSDPNRGLYPENESPTNCLKIGHETNGKLAISGETVLNKLTYINLGCETEDERDQVTHL